MPLRDLLRKREKILEDVGSSSKASSSRSGSPPPFTFLRTTTSTQEVIYPPSFPGDPKVPTLKHKSRESRRRPPSLQLRKSSGKSASSTEDGPTTPTTPNTPTSERRLSSRLDLLHLGRHRPTSPSSVYIPADLPEIHRAADEGGHEVEAEWEKRAALLAQQNQKIRPPSRAVGETGGTEMAGAAGYGEKAVIESDINIQEAIRLHEAGDLERSTAMFGRLADPAGANDALAQILYGMALQHGWGIAASPALALHYHTLAASTSAAIETHALSSGSARGGAAKGELVLAIYELGNAFRHGWGCARDAVAARKYYETAAELGDVDAMNEVAWCYETGFGGAKDKFKAARYLRMAEERGSKVVGNSWIYKDKYGGPPKPAPKPKPK